MAAPTPLRITLCLTGAMVCPFVFWSLTLILWHHFGRDWNVGVGWTIFAASILAGCVCLAFLPLPPVARIILICVYAAPTAYLVFAYGFYFVGFMYGDWL